MSEFSALTPIRELPDPFLRADGSRVTSPEEWPAQREYLKGLLTKWMYGSVPPAPGNTAGQVLRSGFLYGGLALREQVRITFGPGLSFEAEVTRPLTNEPVPVIVQNGWKGRLQCPDEEEIVVNRGYAVAAFDREQLAKDGPEGIDGPLAKAYPGYGWGEIAMWGWLQSRVIDWLETTAWADMKRVIVTGHSRCGKAALWCGIYDGRAAVCAVNGSGCGGVGCYRYLGGRLGEGTAVCETAGSMEDLFPYWWCDGFGAFGDRSLGFTRSSCREMPATEEAARQARFGTTAHEELMPFDGHTARLLVAPRAIISTDALGDVWANPYGCQLNWRAAQEVYDFLGVPKRNAMHYREGGHDFQPTDWRALTDFARGVFTGEVPASNTVYGPEEESPRDWRCERYHYSWRRPE